MVIHAEVQYGDGIAHVPNDHAFNHWLSGIETPGNQVYEVCIRIVDESESALLNKNYRGKNKPTNVLSFPMQAPPGTGLCVLGDLVICAPLVEQEARIAGKHPEHHWAHLAIHGALHLQGYDHETQGQAQQMETLEVELLAQLGIPNPYGDSA